MSVFLPQGKQLVLASKSPRRAELLSQAGIPFTVCASQFPENLAKQQMAPKTYAEATAVAKAEEVARELGGDVIVLAADTIVEGLPGEIWEKPETASRAKSMLRSLSNRSHDVHTGVAIVHGETVKSLVATTSVTFVDLDEDLIELYVASGSPFDKAGGYGIQDMWMVESIVGDYFNVVGLPVSRVLAELRAMCS